MENNDFDYSNELNDLLASISIPNSSGTQSRHQEFGKLEKRMHFRHPLHWRVAIISKGSEKNDIYHGHSRDVSLDGISILLDHNIFFTSEVVILLAIPSMHAGHKETILEIQCKTSYTLLDSMYGQFRVGMDFIHFKGEGKFILSDLLSKRNIPNGL